MICGYGLLQLQNFKRHLAQLLSEVDQAISEDEEAILCRIKDIVKHYTNIRSVRRIATDLPYVAVDIVRAKKSSS